MKTQRQSSGKNITLRDIALQAGCSTNTASLALRDSKRISQQMRKRVSTLAKKLGYIPNFAARNLSTNRSGIIGIYTQSLYDAVRTELVNSLIGQLHSAEYRPVLGLGLGHDGPWHTSPWMRTFRELKVEALVVVAEAIDKLPSWAKRMPMILVGCQPEQSLRCDYLALDRKAAGAMGIEHLLSGGHKKILVACGEESIFAQGCSEALAEAGIKPRYISANYPGDDEQLDALITLIKNSTAKRNAPTAVIFGDSPLAAKFMHRILQLKVRIPGDLAVVGYDYFPWASMLKVPLTTVAQPISELARGAVELVQERLANPNAPTIGRILDHKLTVRKSS